MPKYLSYPLLFALIFVSLLACRSEAPAPVPLESPLISPLNSPVSTPTPLPTPTEEETVAEPSATPALSEPFRLDQPILIGDTSVSGTGPANVPLYIFEVAVTADLLGEVTTAEDGTFSVEFPNRPLQLGERVGLTVGDLSDTPYTTDDFRDIALRDVPTYGFILDDVAVDAP